MTSIATALHTAGDEHDRALIEEVHTDRRGRIRGATLVSSRAGEAIGTIAVTMRSGLRLGDLSAVIQPYPTIAEVWRKLGDAYRRDRLAPPVRRLLTWLFGRRR